MRLLQKDLKRISLFGFSDKESSYLGTERVPVFKGFIYASVRGSEDRLNGEEFGLKESVKLILFYKPEQVIAKVGDVVDFDKASYRIVSVNCFNSYSELIAESVV